MDSCKKQPIITYTRDTAPTPSYIVEEGKLKKNLSLLKQVQERTGCKILLAQKCFSMFHEYPLIGSYLSGCTASGLYEARLGYEEMVKAFPERHVDNHVFSPAYKEKEFGELLTYVDHVSFNSLAQLSRYRDMCNEAKVSYGIRINPEISTQEEHAIYDPCAPGSRLGITLKSLQEALLGEGGDGAFEKTLDEKDALSLMGGVLEGVQGIHFHTLCEQNSDALEITLQAVEEKFGALLHHMKWVNMGGGHHITREDYDVERLIRLILHVKETYDVEVYLEPGEAVALNAGLLKTEVLDLVENAGITTLILDASAACHMPDVLEMPYRPPLKNSDLPGKKPYTYRLSAHTCLAGDIIGDYSFDTPIKVGDDLYFEDMAIYSMVKNNTFNGIGLPSILVEHEDGVVEVVKTFGYEDFKMRLS